MTLGEMCKLRSWASLSNEFGTDSDGDVRIDGDDGYAYVWNSLKHIFIRGRTVKIVKVVNSSGVVKLDQYQYMAVHKTFFVPQEVLR